MAYSVKFTGFETEHQAKTFADWYSGQGEQQSGIWLEEHSDIIYAITESFSRKPDDNGEIQVPPVSPQEVNRFIVGLSVVELRGSY